MPTGFLIDAATRQIGALRLSDRSFMADLKAALGGDGVELGARLADGAKIYLDPLALYTSSHYFRHYLAGTALPGRGIIVGDQPLTEHQVRCSVDFLSREEAFAELERNRIPALPPYQAWMRGVERGRPGVSIFCNGASWRLS